MKIFLLLLFFFSGLPLFSQNVGIGTATPAARLHVADSNVVFTGPYPSPVAPGSPPVSGQGTRMMWYADKGAFRVGTVTGNQWDDANVGPYSHVIGFNSIASYTSAIAIGYNNSAGNLQSMAIGNNNISFGSASIVLGNTATANVDNAMMFGNNVTAFSAYETVLGRWNIGGGTPTNSWNPADRLFVIGNGTDVNNKSDAIVVLKNGNTGIGNSTPRFPLSFKYADGDKINLYDDGNASQVHFGFGIASGQLLQVYSATPFDDIAFGYGKSASFTERMRIKGNGKVGIGTSSPSAILHIADSSVLFTAPAVLPVTPGNTPVSGPGNRMMWYADKAAFRAGNVNNNSWDKDNIGNVSFAVGSSTQASGITAFASGNFSFATGDASTAMGFSVQARAKGGFSTGIYNDITDNPNPTTEAATDRIFQVGSGTTNLSRTNALTILRNGNIGVMGVINPAKPLSFPASIGEKILLYPGGAGEVGIGVYGNELRLHCDNPGSMVSFGTQDNAGVFTQAGRFQISAPYALYVNGSIWANGTTYASDERFKQNITPIGSPLQKLLQLNGVEYEMKASEFSKNNFLAGRQMGLLAQNVEKIVPEAVNEMDGFKGVDYARLVPLLIESIKEQQKQIDELKAKLNSFQNK